MAAAYRSQAKRWHPDRGGGEEAARRMAEINAAYDLLRAGAAQAARRPEPTPRAGARPARKLASGSRSPGTRAGAA